MKQENYGQYLQKLVEESKLVKKKAECRDNVLMMGTSLLQSFGLDLENPAKESDLERGYVTAKAFLEKVCKAFKDPTHIVRVAPFAYAHLGSEVFNQVLDVVLERAESHPDEQDILDEIFTGAGLLKPEQRAGFLKSVKKNDDITNELFGLAGIISAADPKLAFSSPAEFPREFRTSDEQHAMELLGAFLELSLFKPGQGFSREYELLLQRMGSFDYLLKTPSLDHALVIGEGVERKLRGFPMLEYEITPEHDARPKNTGKNPAYILVSKPVSPEQIKRLYRHSTVIYFAKDKSERKKIENALGAGNENLLVGTLQEDNVPELLLAHIHFIKNARQEYGEADLKDLLQKELGKAESMLKAGNEHFYDVRDIFEGLGRRNLVDELVKEKGYKLPVRTDYELVMLLSPQKNDLMPLFDGVTRKKVKHYSELPPLEETGMPFVIITNTAITEQDVLKKYPSATIIYLADDGKEKKMRAANPGNDIFVVPLERAHPAYIGERIVRAYFDSIAQSRGKGITRMAGIAKGISDEIKKARDQILFATYLNDFYHAANEFYQLQERHKISPLVAQLTDGVMMAACPTGGCFKLNEPERGGCCGGGNVPDILIDFAINYRKTVGEKRFVQELKRYNAGKVKEPWYFESMRYRRNFKEGLRETAGDAADVDANDDMVF